MDTLDTSHKTPLNLRVFLASPGDVAEERALALDILARLPADPLLRGQLAVDAVAWDRPGAGMPMLAGLTPQEAIAAGLPKPSECDIVVVLFWSRIGTPLPPGSAKPDGTPYWSGTEWEYLDAAQAAAGQDRPKILLYRRTEKIALDPDEPDFEERAAQRKKVRAFFDQFRNPDGSLNNGVNDYANPAEFKDRLAHDLRAVIKPWLPGGTSNEAPGLSQDYPAAARRYLAHVEDKHRYLNFRGFGLAERVPLKLPLLDLYVPLKARLELPHGETWSRDLKLAGRALEEGGRLGEPGPVLDLLQGHDGLVVLGDPGAGKTTFLKYLALRLAADATGWPGLADRLPILAPLSGYANRLDSEPGLGLDEYLAGCFPEIEVRGLFAAALGHGAALVLLDGLDEVAEPGMRQYVVDRVSDFYLAHRRQGNRFVLTSRIIGYRDVRPAAPGLAECTLVDFNDEEIGEFVERWTLALETQAQGESSQVEQDARRERQGLLEAVRDNPGVRQLAANPLLLTVLALMKRQNIRLPERRAELYQRYVETLLSSWNRARSLGRPSSRDLDPARTVKILAPLALWMHEANPGVGLVKREHLRRQLEALYRQRGEAEPAAPARQFLADVRDHAGLLLERGPGEYGFIHLTFEEYLAAAAIALAHQGDAAAIAEALGRRVGDAAWHEIIRLTVGYVGLVQQMDRVAGGIVQALAAQQPGPPGEAVVLAGEAVADACEVGVDAGSRAKVIDALIATMRQPDVPGKLRRRAGWLLGRLGWAPEDLDHFVEVPAGPFLYGDDKQPRTIQQRYWIAQYPVTNRQFARFIEAGGYRRRELWTRTGWEWREEQDISQPEYWEDSEWNNPIFPVVGVSWHEAMAYANWLDGVLAEQGLMVAGRRMDKPQEYAVRLPAEWEWERAARGRDGREYPWEGQFEAAYANTADEEWNTIGGTTAVCAYPQGVSPTGAWDMAGNVWEWCVNPYDQPEDPDLEGDDRRVRRGGSWDDLPRFARAAFRGGNLPVYRFYDVGFRLVCAVPIVGR